MNQYNEFTFQVQLPYILRSIVTVTFLFFSLSLIGYYILIILRFKPVIVSYIFPHCVKESFPSFDLH